MPESVCCNGKSTAKDKNNNKIKEKVWKDARNRIRTLFYWQTCGQVLSMGSLLAVQMLQTSINIKNHVGSISVTAGFVTSIFVGLLVCPTLLHTLGATRSLILSEICYLIYCACNFYPELYVLIPGAIFSGIGRALFVPSYSMIFITLTLHCAANSPCKDEVYYFNQLQSRYYCLNEFVQIVGNGLSYAILYSTYNPQEAFEGAIENSTTLNISSSASNVTLYQFCGVNDCQDDDVLQQSLHQYVPPSKSSIYLFLSATILLSAVAITIHCTVFPGVGLFAHKLFEISRRVDRLLSSEQEEIGSYDNHIFLVPRSSSGSNGAADEKFFQNRKHLKRLSNSLCHEEKDAEDEEIGSEGGRAKLLEIEQKNLKKEEKDEESGYWRVLKSTMLFFIRPRALLIGVASLHTGMLVGFAFADLTRAYASCVAGVQMTGAFGVTFGVAGMLSSLIYGRILPVFGRTTVYVFASTLEVGVYFLCYLWVPDPRTLYVVFCMFFGMGFVNGMIRQNLIAAYTVHFPKSKSLGLTAFNVAYTGGIGVQYGLSTFMCVSSKIFAQIGITVAGMLCYTIAEFLMTNSCREELSIAQEMKADAMESSKENTAHNGTV